MRITNCVIPSQYYVTWQPNPGTVLRRIAAAIVKLCNANNTDVGLPQPLTSILICFDFIVILKLSRKARFATLVSAHNTEPFGVKKLGSTLNDRIETVHLS